MESLGHMEAFDIHLLGYSDTVTMALSKALGWDDSNSEGFDPTAPFAETGGKRLPGTSPVDLSCRQGAKEWQWLFDGAIEQKPESESEEDEESIVSTDSNTVSDHSKRDEDPEDGGPVEGTSEQPTNLEESQPNNEDSQ
jgi:hypothetical protein